MYIKSFPAPSTPHLLDHIMHLVHRRTFQDHHQYTRRGAGTGSGANGGSSITSNPTTIIIIFVAIVALAAVGFVTGSRLRLIQFRRQRYAAIIAARQKPPTPPSLDVLEQVAPVQKCSAWFKARGKAPQDGGEGSAGVVTLNYGIEMKDMSEAGVDCAICLKSFEADEDMRELPCLHPFHQSCFDDYYTRGSTTCPLCRTALVAGPETAEAKEEIEAVQGNAAARTEGEQSV